MVWEYNLVTKIPAWHREIEKGLGGPLALYKAGMVET